MRERIPRFDRKFLDGAHRFTCIGDGEVGGKAAGLFRIHGILRERIAAGAFPSVVVDIPTMAVLTTDLFEAFVERNALRECASGDLPDDRIADAFQRASFPAEFLGDLRAIADGMHTPLAIRSSSLLEDAIYRPFAGVYGTKMIPNNQPDADTRFRKLVEAVKLVYASTYFSAARSYVRTTDRSIDDERMAVIVQEIVGARHGERFYPDFSGVARSWNFYRSGDTRPEDGVVSLALGLGKTIVDGGMVWSYSPARPGAGPPFASAADALKRTQSEFWAVNMGKPPAYDPIRETEYLVQAGLAEAEEDGTLLALASTYDPASDRLYPGAGRAGARVLTFAPLLQLDVLPLNDLLKRLLAVCEEALGEKVEIEFAVAFDPKREGPARVGFLQVRPLAIAEDRVAISDAEMASPDVLLASDNVMGNGVESGIVDVVYVKRAGFDPLRTPAVASEIAALNLGLLERRTPYVLIGFGRWGSSDPSLGIPVRWGDICAARALVEATLPAMNVEPSQGSHFFHNISSFGVSYFCVRHDGDGRIDFDRLDAMPAEQETPSVRHVRLPRPVAVRVDGRSGRGLVRFEE